MMSHGIQAGGVRIPPGQILYTKSGAVYSTESYDFVVPDGVTAISAVCVGGSIKRGSTVLLTAGNYTSGSTIGGNIGGGNGGIYGNTGTYTTPRPGGGGAGGYSGNGGNGQTTVGETTTLGQPGTGGGGAGGGNSGKGGGVGVYGAGASGETPGAPGSGGSGANYGGGSNGYVSGTSPYKQIALTPGYALRYSTKIPVTPGETLSVILTGGDSNSQTGNLACRIIWGTGRAYPSTNTQDM